MAINAGTNTRDAPADMLMYDPMSSPRQEGRKSTLGWFLSLQPRFLVSIGCEFFRLGLGRDYSPGWSSGWMDSELDGQSKCPSRST